MMRSQVTGLYKDCTSIMNPQSHRTQSLPTWETSFHPIPQQDLTGMKMYVLPHGDILKRDL